MLIILKCASHFFEIKYLLCSHLSKFIILILKKWEMVAVTSLGVSFSCLALYIRKMIYV